MLRLFFALQPAEAQGAGLVEAVAPLVAQLGGQRVPASNLHATLCFVGAVAAEKLPLLCAAAARVRGNPATLDFDALDYWDKPEVIVATSPEAESARDLSARLFEQTIAAGFAPDRKPFRPHLTLARKVRRRDAAKISWPRVLEEKVGLRCDRFVLMESRRGDAGSVYSVVDSWPLDGENGPANIQ
ncbi:MAG TPA: RNA 2',3'-cyclic phosphodiesterase [Steroidobacteraceae bacterium]|nr:RNA 2',3'-cyclic phosphodiesterase [Steroidobacteraceae bacterium]